MKKIPLTKGQFALVDDDDYEILSKRKWYAIESHNGFRAARSITVQGKQKAVLMHRQLLGLSLDSDELVDHANGNPLDNRRSNIRKCTYSENNQNKQTTNNTHSIYKGVSWCKSGMKWRARIYLNSKEIALGMFSCAIKAAKAYDEAAVQYFGKFAKTNFNKGQ